MESRATRGWGFTPLPAARSQTSLPATLLVGQIDLMQEKNMRARPHEVGPARFLMNINPKGSLILHKSSILAVLFTALVLLAQGCATPSPRLRFSLNLYGAPALSLEEFASYQRRHYGRQRMYRSFTTTTHPNPGNTASARFTATRVISSSRPEAWPTFSRGTVVALSTITCERFFRPVSTLGSTSMRSRGAFRNSLVTGNTVMEGCSVKDRIG